MKSILHQNLVLLGTDDDLMVQYQDNPNQPKVVDKIIYFLFSQMATPKELQKRLGSCWPIIDRIGSKEFRTACFKWSEDLKREGLLPADLPLRKSFFEDGAGERFDTILAWISVLGLKNQRSEKFVDPVKALKVDEIPEFLNALQTERSSLEQTYESFREESLKFDILRDCLYGSANNVCADDDFSAILKSLPGTGDSSRSLTMDQQIECLFENVEAHVSLPIADRRKELQESLKVLTSQYEGALLKNRRLRHEIEETQSKMSLPVEQPVISQGRTLEPLVIAETFPVDVFKPNASNKRPELLSIIALEDVDGDFLVK